MRERIVNKTKKIVLKDHSLKGLCKELLNLVERTEITELRIVPGIIYYKPTKEYPPTGDGPIYNLIDIIKEVCRKYPVIEIRVNPNKDRMAHFHLEFNIWNKRIYSD